ncbi:hypothetical protein FOL47_005240, partial [Perkinsus chesapeaki]
SSSLDYTRGSHPIVWLVVFIARRLNRECRAQGSYRVRYGSSHRSHGRSSGSARIIRSSRSAVIHRPHDTRSERGASYEMFGARRLRPATAEPSSAPSRHAY